VKIGFFYVPYYPLSMGRSVHGMNLVRGLKRRGHQILSCLGDGNPECINYDRTKKGALEVAQASDLLYIRIAGRPVHSYLEKSTLLKLARPFSLPVVWEVNAPVEELLGSYPPGPERDLLIRRENRKRKFLARLVDAGIGVSDVLKEYINKDLGIKNAYSIPNASDPELFDPRGTRETVLNRLGGFKLFWMGNATTPWQGIELILEIARRMEQSDPDVIFILVTGDSLVNFPVLNNLLVLRQISYCDMPHYLAAADICLCLYKEYDWIRYGFYGSALKLFDYMAAQKPVIASDMGQITQVIRDGVNGVLVQNEVEMIVDKIRELKKGRELRENLARNAREDVMNYYNWDRVAEQTEKVLMDVFQ
jgi:glycosyltransferase involved in cell wall biosynthesis